MLGLGEKDEEVIQSMKDLRDVNADILTIGQYLRPSSWHIPISNFVEPSKFEYYKQKALEFTRAFKSILTTIWDGVFSLSSTPV